MLLAVAPLLDRVTPIPWFGENKAFPIMVAEHHGEQGGQQVAEVPVSMQRPNSSLTSPLYVLISRKTASAAEAVAIEWIQIGQDLKNVDCRF